LRLEAYWKQADQIRAVGFTVRVLTVTSGIAKRWITPNSLCARQFQLAECYNFEFHLRARARKTEFAMPLLYGAVPVVIGFQGLHLPPYAAIMGISFAVALQA